MTHFTLRDPFYPILPYKHTNKTFTDHHQHSTTTRTTTNKKKKKTNDFNHDPYMGVVDVSSDGGQVVAGGSGAVDGEHGGFQTLFRRLVALEADPLVGWPRGLGVMGRSSEVLLRLAEPTLGLA